MRGQPTSPQWVCMHCYIHLVNDDCTDVLYADPDREDLDACSEGGKVPMSLFEGMDVTPGMLDSEHDCNIHSVEREECDCEKKEFSWQSCDGCGSILGGERQAVTGWVMA